MFRTYTGTVSVVAAKGTEFHLQLDNGDEFAVRASENAPSVAIGEALVVFGEIADRDESPPYAFDAREIRRKDRPDVGVGQR